MTDAKTGTLFGVSLGPGDPGLITRRTWDLLTGDGHWTYPVRSKGNESYALDIVRRAGLQPPREHTPLIFPMTRDAGVLAKYWLRAGEAVRKILQRGRDVLFLVEGDACTYSTFAHLARTVTALNGGVAIEIVPGVTSYHAAAAHLRTPLADADDAIAIIPAAYGIDTIDRLLDQFDTLVLLKIKPLLDDIITLLERRGLLEYARFVEKVGTPDERTIERVATLRNTTANYLSLMLVRNPHRARGELIRGCRSKRRAETDAAHS